MKPRRRQGRLRRLTYKDRNCKRARNVRRGRPRFVIVDGKRAAVLETPETT